MAKSVTISSMEYDVEWQRVRQMEGKILDEAFKFAKEEWGAEIVQDGWDAFSLGRDLERDCPDSKQFFPGWFVFRWIPFDYSKRWGHLGPNLTIAHLYLQKKNLRSEYKNLLLEVDKSPFSFFLVEDVIPSKRLMVKDLILNRTISIKEKSAADVTLKGVVLFGMLVSFKNQSIQIGLGTISLPTRYAMNVLDLKQQILKQDKDLTVTSLINYDNDLREAYLEWSEVAYRPPVLYNKDGDSIKLCTLYYILKCSPKTAFDCLIPLCMGEDPEEILEDGEFDQNHELVAIEFPWIKNKSTKIIQGHIEIKKDKLIIHVNSIERSKDIQGHIEKRLPEAVFNKMDTESPENIKDKKLSPPSKPSDEEKKVMEAFLQKYYQDWLETSIPSLKGKTPLEASKTAEGRERLELLLLDLELNNYTDSNLRPDIKSIRQELGFL